MGFIFKSAIGLGAVYFAMFGPAGRPSDLAPAANLCASALHDSAVGESSLRAQWAAIGCGSAVLSETKRLVEPVAARAPAPPPERPAASARNGSLTDADLQAPWFGPARVLRKTTGRG